MLYFYLFCDKNVSFLVYLLYNYIRGDKKVAKFCVNCGKELDENAELCLNCGKLVNEKKEIVLEKKKKGLPAWAIVLIVLACLFIILPIIGGIILFNVYKDDFKDFGDLIKDEIDNKGVKYGTINDTLDSGNIELTLNDAYIYSSIGEGENINIPKAGKEYLVFFFDAKNIGSEDEYLSHYDFTGYADDYLVSNIDISSEINGVESLSFSLAPNMKGTFYIAYEIDTTWEEFEIHFTNDIFSDSIVFKVVSEDND